ncbi:mycolic acid cyclopropane synthetase [Varunaivibrio sulfuroxidans]|uniref:Mycolic acid cyclopropane synthetase n=2 Tax=Varunaivibrio sulfuroxidans TaxID=1773489 RepID=A0A4R3J7R9_9PROT|nr:mycolic acid cyclopropane synthetase [Varunaivibrio sulfuroxidans]
MRKWPWRRAPSSPGPRRRKPPSTQAEKRSTQSKKTPKAQTLWPNERLFIVDRLWGDDHTVPGGTAYIKTLLPLLNLSKEKSLLLLGAGLGGMGRAMVEETGVWVSGLEHDRELAAIGKNMAIRSGMKKRAPVTYKDFNALKLKPRSFNAVVSFESMHPVSDKAALFAALGTALRPQGELLFTELVLSEATEPNAAVLDWLRSEPHSPHPSRASEIFQHLKALDFDVRPPENITADYRRRVLRGWSAFLGTTNKTELRTISQAVIEECAFWARRISAIDSGGLHVYKFHAIKKADRRPPPPL